MGTASTIRPRAGTQPGHGPAITALGTRQASPARPYCFMTSKRLFCDDTACEFRRECRRLIAAWQR